MPTSEMPRDAGKAADERLAEARLESIELREPSTMRAITSRHIVGSAQIRRHDTEDLLRVIGGRIARPRTFRRKVSEGPELVVENSVPQRTDRLPRECQRMRVVLGQRMSATPGEPRMHVTAAQVFGADDLAGGRTSRAEARPGRSSLAP
jgi:hypothetical protein